VADLALFLAEQADQMAPGGSVLLRDVAYERIKDAIRHGALQPGEPLSETRLSQLLGISRTPVREALQGLAQEGLVQIIPGRAITVAAPSIDDALNAIQVRSILEPAVVRLSTEAMQTGQLERLWQALLTMEEAAARGDRAAWTNADTQFHEIISAACPNRLLGELSLQIRNRMSYVAIDTKTSSERLAECTVEHRTVVERMAERDAPGAEQAMREHIKMLWESTFRRFNHA
jgi:DNA-binding GntR family transcriptional regulator